MTFFINVYSSTVANYRYYCESPSVDSNTQTVIGCRSNGTVLVPCYAAPNITCGNSDYDPGQNVFCKEEPCQYVLVDNSYNIKWDTI